MVNFVRFCGIILFTAPAAFPQGIATAGLSGRVLSETARPVRAIVMLSLFDSPRGYPAPPRRAFTDLTGSFSFSRLPAGRYKLCAQIPASEAPAASPFVDSCVWGSGQGPIDIAAGQQASGVICTARRGARLKIRVVDPERTLPQPAAGRVPAMLEPQLLLVMKTPTGFHHQPNFVSSDASGRTYQMVIPLNTDLGLSAHSSVADVFDNGNNKIKDTETPVRAISADPPQVTLTLHRKGN